MSKPTVFISYSHLDEEWKDWLVRHLAVSQKQGHLELWHDRMIGAGEDWERQIQEAMNAASVAILLVSANSLTSDFILRDEVSRLLDRRAREGLRIFPVVIKPCDWEAVDWLRRMNLRPKDGKPLSGGSEHEVDQALAEIAREVRTLLNQTASSLTGQSAQTSSSRFVPLGPDKISLARLPQLLTRDLFGRETELKLLDDAWANPATNVVTFVAWGGVGKTALVNHWVRRMAQRNYDGAARVYAWSFYSHGTSETQAATAEYFINDALGWFGDPDPTQGSPWDKGERLAHLIRAQRTLLVLDGLEPLQHPPNEIGLIEGRLKEQSMQALLRELAAGQPGLCVISTRVAVNELEDYESDALRYDLDQLTPEAGAQLLRKLGVTGEDNELEQAAAEFGGHSLALTLLGGYLNEVFNGDVRRRREIDALTADAQHGGHARRVMASYEKWLGDGPELAILRLLGLFDRPADAPSIAALRAAPAIPGLTDALQPLSEPQWQQTQAKLRRIRLLAERPAQVFHQNENELDAHPLVREHFRRWLQQTEPDAWRAGNARLYDYLTHTAKDLPDTAAEMEPLYAAIAHGCAAGRMQQAFDEVFLQRIRRGDEQFSIFKLGTFSAELAALRGFFVLPWHQLFTELHEASQVRLLNEAGIVMLALGRLSEAAEPIESSLKKFIDQGNLKNAAISAINLSELLLKLGNVSRALATAQLSVKLANQDGFWEWRMISRAKLADVFHQAGQHAEAEVAFAEAEELQKKRQPVYPLLYALQGYLYCDLLLTQGKAQEAHNRSAQNLEWLGSQYPLRDLALDRLALGRACQQLAQKADADDNSNAADWLHLAVDGLRRAGQIHHLPLGLLARAAYFRWVRRYDEAQHDLDEALRIATRGSMRLHQADCHLESARLALTTGDHASARKAWETAKVMIEEMGYHRRDGEVKEIEHQLNTG